MKTQTGTIDFTPTWTAVLPVYLALLYPTMKTHTYEWSHFAGANSIYSHDGRFTIERKHYSSGHVAGYVVYDSKGPKTRQGWIGDADTLAGAKRLAAGKVGA